MNRDLARRLATAQFSEGGVLRLRRWQGRWWLHDGCRYRQLPEEQFTAKLWASLDKERNPDGGRIAVNRHLIGEVAEAMVSLDGVLVEGPMPQWLDGRESPAPTSIVAFENGLLDVDEFCRTGRIEPLPPTPQWFSTAACPYPLDPEAMCPEFTRFIAETFPDAETIDLVREWFGLNLVPDMSQEKFALLIGPPRSGKGTLLDVLIAVLGRDQVDVTDLERLTSKFGLGCLPGKLALVVGDAELGNRTDSRRVLEVVKGIVGRDPLSVEKKYRDPSLEYLTCRISIAANGMPRLPDEHSALVARLLPITFTKSVVGREDPGLKDRLRLEAPGVAVWALRGLRSLRQRGRFALPAQSQAMLDRLRVQFAPIRAFIEVRCKVSPGLHVPKTVLHAAFNEWAGENDSRPIDTLAGFTQKLGEIVAPLGSCKRGSRGNQVAHYSGIALIGS